MRLSIVIPAYNEEEAVAAIIERCLAARAEIVRNSPVKAVDIIVVSDGSSDRTVEIASEYEEIRLIVFERNRGYGAAIKRGFAESRGELVGFLDADGTCDPVFFANLCRAIVDEGADVALGSRMGPDSRMPRVRRLGNRIYALILSMLSNRPVTDTASGMRVIRREALESLYPLPDGLHFTPAMSARVLMDERLRLVERPMRYEERTGRSKLSVVRDGVRFLRTIVEMTLYWQPARMFLLTATVMMAAAGMLALYPLEQWVRTGGFAEDMIYRLLFCSFLGVTGVMLLSAGVLADSLHSWLTGREGPRTFVLVLAHTFYRAKVVAALSITAVPLVIWLIGPGIRSRIVDGVVTVHWSRVVLAGVAAFALCTLAVTGLLLRIMRFHVRRGTLGAGTRLLKGTATRSEVEPVPALAAPSRMAILPD